MEDILDIMPIGVFVLDANFKVARINIKLEEYFGIKRQEVLFKDKRNLVTEKIHKIFENGDDFQKRVLATYDDNSYIERFICHVLPGTNREERWLEHSSQPIRMGSFQGGRVEVYTDITDRILAEQEINWIATQTMQLQEKEKARIASDLHDGLGQTILAIKFALQNHQEALKNNPSVSDYEKNELQKTIAWVETLGRDVSNISSNLMPSILAPLGLNETLIWLKDQYMSMYGLKIQFHSIGISEKRLPETLEVAIYRVFQEGLNNIVKHASAQNIQLRLIYSHPKVIISISDDGKGFNTEDKFQIGTGLRIMKRRISELNGQFKITSEVNKGTNIRAEIPIPEG